MRHSSKNGCTDLDEVYNPFLKRWECAHCGNELGDKK